METEINSELSPMTQGKKRVYKNLIFPLPDGRVNLEKHFIVFKYMFRNGNKFLSAIEVGANTKINDTMVSGIFGFFYKIGLLYRDKNKYSLKEEFLEAIKNLVWNKEDEAKKLLSKLYLNCWFGTFIQEKSILSPNISKEDLMSDIGLICGADPIYHNNAIIRLIEIMEDSKLIIYNTEDKMYNFNLEIKVEKKDLDNNVSEKNTPEIKSENILSKQEPITTKFDTPLNLKEFYTITINGFGKTDIYNIEEVEDIEIITAALNKVRRKLTDLKSKNENY